MWNFQDSSSDSGEDAIDFDVSSVSSRLHAQLVKQKESEQVKTIPIQPPSVGVVLPLPQCHGTELQIQKRCPAIMKTIIQTIKDAKKHDSVFPVRTKELPLRDSFDTIDDETEKRLTERYFELQPETILARIEDDITIPRPPSPGCEYDNQYIAGEIGRKPPRFRASALESMLKESTSGNLSKTQTLLQNARKYERDIKLEYRTHSQISNAVDGTVRRLKRLRRMKRSRRRKRHKQHLLKLNA